MSLLTDVIGYGTHAARPAATSAGRLYYETDTSTLFRDSGTAWVALPLGAGGAPTLQLDWHATSDLMDETVLTANVWQDLCADQSFSTDGGLLAISVRGQAQAGETSNSGAVASRLILDAAGTPLTYNLGAGWHIAGENTFVNVFDGAGTVYVAGMAAGSHTIKVQLFPNVAGFAVYCRALSFPDTESLSIQIVEF